MRSTPRSNPITVSGVTGTVPPHGPHNPPVEDPANTSHPQGAFYLNQMQSPPPPPKRWPGWKIALLVAALCSPVLVLAVIATAAESRPEPAARQTGIGSPAPYDALPGQQAPTSAGSKDSSGAKACAAVRVSNNGPSPFDQEPAAMAAIAVDGKLSTNPFIRGAAEKLAQAAKEAVAARGTDDEPIQGIKMGTAALNLETTCIEQWYYPPAK
jgi:hypothetical protein